MKKKAYSNAKSKVRKYHCNISTFLPSAWNCWRRPLLKAMGTISEMQDYYTWNVFWIELFIAADIWWFPCLKLIVIVAATFYWICMKYIIPAFCFPGRPNHREELFCLLYLFHPLLFLIFVIILFSFDFFGSPLNWIAMLSLISLTQSEQKTLLKELHNWISFLLPNFTIYRSKTLLVCEA